MRCGVEMGVKKLRSDCLWGIGGYGVVNADLSHPLAPFQGGLFVL